MFRHLDFYNCDKRCGGGKILIFYIIIIILTFVCAREKTGLRINLADINKESSDNIIYSLGKILQGNRPLASQRKDIYSPASNANPTVDKKINIIRYYML